jgi:hypothetical protein
VRNVAAGGTRLSARQIYAIVLWWVRFDAVTCRFARPWCWREHYCAPMHATGAERAEAAWDHTRGADAITASAGSGHGANGAAAKRVHHSVPALVRALHHALSSEGFVQLSDEEQVERLVAASGVDRANVGRYLSLNIYALRKHGTLEFRRFHGTLDARLLVRWAHFCVCFVEVFASAPWPAALEAPSADAALAELRAAQETATADELMLAMRGHVHPETAQYFVRDALGSEDCLACAT